MTTIDRVMEHITQYHDIPRLYREGYRRQLESGEITPRQLLIDLDVFIPDWVEHDSENAEAFAKLQELRDE